MFNVHNLEILNFQESTLCHRDHRHHVDAVPAVWGQLLAQPVIHHLLIVDIHWPTFIVIIIMVIAFRLNLHCHSSKHAMYGLLSQSYSRQKFLEEGGAGIWPNVCQICILQFVTYETWHESTTSLCSHPRMQALPLQGLHADKMDKINQDIFTFVALIDAIPFWQ